MSRTIGTLRTFRTAQFTVIVDALPEDDLDLSWDEDGSVAAGLDSGKFMAFIARARVIHKTLGEVATDYLGGCIYESLEAFMDHRECGKTNRESLASDPACISRCGSYFADMVSNVCDEARKTIADAKTIRVRT